MRVFHGDSKKSIYNVWHGMVNRCRNPILKVYPRYGGRGIKVCEEWHDYFIFKEWAMNNGYDESLTIERKDNNGNYCPENCAWVTMKQQQNNKSNSHRITYNGQIKTITEWGDVLGISAITLRSRIIKCGWSTEKAFSAPIRKLSKKFCPICGKAAKGRGFCMNHYQHFMKYGDPLLTKKTGRSDGAIINEKYIK